MLSKWHKEEIYFKIRQERTDFMIFHNLILCSVDNAGKFGSIAFMIAFVIAIVAEHNMMYNETWKMKELLKKYKKPIYLSLYVFVGLITLIGVGIGAAID